MSSSSFISRIFNSKIARVIEKLFGERYRAACGHRQYGLLYEDTLNLTPVVKEALRRLPENQRIERARRIRIANDLALKGNTLPPEKWIKPEEDIPYLRRLMIQVEKEMNERKNFRLD